MDNITPCYRTGTSSVCYCCLPMGSTKRTTCKLHLLILYVVLVLLNNHDGTSAGQRLTAQQHKDLCSSRLPSLFSHWLLYGCISLRQLESMPGAAPWTALTLPPSRSLRLVPSVSHSLALPLPLCRMVIMLHIKAATPKPFTGSHQGPTKASSWVNRQAISSSTLVEEEDWLADYPIHGYHLIHGGNLCYTGQHQRPNSCAISLGGS